jgi:hypothetical protein
LLFLDPSQNLSETLVLDNGGTQLMLKAFFELIGTMMEDPRGHRSDIRKQLLDIADTMPPAPMAV